MQSLPVIELFAIGTELALGRIQDSNAYWIAQQVAGLGGCLHRITVLNDELEDIVQALQSAIDRGAQLLITTGGLGPTPDDMTVAALAQLKGCGTTVDSPTLADYLRRKGLSRPEEATPNLVKMATVPEGAAAFRNPAGWAPCIRTTHAGAVIFTLPGPPREVMPLFDLYVGPYIASLMPGKTVAARVAVLLPEVEASGPMQEVMRRFPSCYLKAYVAMRQDLQHALPMDVVARGESEEEAQEILRQALAYLEELVAQKGCALQRWEEKK